MATFKAYVVAQLVLLCVCIALASDDGQRFIPGGWHTADPDEENVQKAARFAASTLSAASNSPYHKKLTNVIEAETQVVAGVNYRLTIEIKKTKCNKNDVIPDNVNEQCEVDNENPNTERCVVKVHERSWENVIQLTEFTCEPQE